MVGGQAIVYVESTIGDIEVANRLAHAVLGQSLDELAPQTRRLLVAVHDHVTAKAADLAVDVSLIRFTRRQLREALGWGDTQLKVTWPGRSTSNCCWSTAPSPARSPMSWPGARLSATGPASL